MTNTISLQHQIAKLVSEAEHILLISHQKPDGDTMGSMLGFANYCASIGKSHTPFCIDVVPEALRYLPLSETVITNWDQVPFDRVDLVIVFDAGDLAYAGVAECIPSKLREGSVIINVDHHRTNTRFGTHNLVIETASSTAEVVYAFLTETNTDINKEIGICLLTGMVTDTGGFTNPATNVEALKAASQILGKGVKLASIVAHLLKEKALPLLRFWGEALGRLEHYPKHDIVYTMVTRDDYRACGVDHLAAEGLSNFLGSVSRARIIMVLKEMPDGTVRGSLRTTEDDVDLSKLAQRFNGGGHKKASGFTLATAQEFNEAFWAAVDQELGATMKSSSSSAAI